MQDGYELRCLKSKVWNSKFERKHGAILVDQTDEAPLALLMHVRWMSGECHTQHRDWGRCKVNDNDRVSILALKWSVLKFKIYWAHTGKYLEYPWICPNIEQTIRFCIFLWKKESEKIERCIVCTAYLTVRLTVCFMLQTLYAKIYSELPLASYKW